MRHLIMACCMLMLHGSSFGSTDNRHELNAIHESVKDRFIYTTRHSEPAREKFVYYNSTEFVRGDCDDFASAAYYELWKRGFDPIIVMYDVPESKYHHVITCGGGYCFDSNKRNVYPQSELDHKQLVVVGHLDETAMHRLYRNEKVPL